MKEMLLQSRIEIFGFFKVLLSKYDEKRPKSLGYSHLSNQRGVLLILFFHISTLHSQTASSLFNNLLKHSLLLVDFVTELKSFALCSRFYSPLHV